jgi:hypothetical protein
MKDKERVALGLVGYDRDCGSIPVFDTSRYFSI